jgi:ankyrin repeat protein
MLMDAGANINVSREGLRIPALQAAASYGWDEMVRVLIDTGADINHIAGGYGPALQDAVSRTADSPATKQRRMKIFKMLIEAGGDINLCGGRYSTVLIAASWNDYEDAVKMLINNEVDVNPVDKYYGTALYAAVFSGNLETVRALIHAGANVHYVHGEEGTALHIASRHGKIGVIQMLIQAGADVNLVAGKYGSPLQAAANPALVILPDKYLIPGVRALIQAGADVNIEGGKYGTALEAALANGRDEIAQILRDAGATPSQKPQKRSGPPPPTDSGAGEREGKNPRLCTCAVTDVECDCAADLGLLVSKTPEILNMIHELYPGRLLTSNHELFTQI